MAENRDKTNNHTQFPYIPVYSLQSRTCALTTSACSYRLDAMCHTHTHSHTHALSLSHSLSRTHTRTGSNIFIYRNLRPYYKFNLPPVDIPTVESEVWSSLKNSKMEAQQVFCCSLSALKHPHIHTCICAYVHAHTKLSKREGEREPQRERQRGR